MNRILLLIALGSLATACASSGQAGIQASALPSCMNRPELQGWHQVSGDGLTFCVPEDWSSTSGRAWRGNEGRIRWAWNTRSDPGEVRVVTEVVAVHNGTVPTPPPAPPTPSPSNPPVGHVYDSRETVGGVQVDLWITRRGSSFVTGATWTTGRRMQMTGEAPTRTAATLQLDIYRSVRLEAQNQPE
jgi:hypothetical protein